MQEEGYNRGYLLYPISNLSPAPSAI